MYDIPERRTPKSVNRKRKRASVTEVKLDDTSGNVMMEMNVDHDAIDIRFHDDRSNGWNGSVYTKPGSLRV